MKNLIIDGTNLLHRTFHSSKKHQELINSQGNDVSHIIYYLDSLKFYVDKFKPEQVFLCWDLRDKKFSNFRHQLVPYKENRTRDPEEEKRIHQYDNLLWRTAEFLNMRCIRASKMEADDIIAWLCLEDYKNDENIIVTTDKDFYQLINDNISIYSPMKDIHITCDNFSVYEDVPLKQFLIYKTIIGDASDNLKGLPKYGPVKAKKFIQNFPDNFKKLDSELQQVFKEQYQVVDLTKGYKYYPDECEFYQKQKQKQPQLNINSFKRVCELLELRQIISEIDIWENTFSLDNESPFDKLKLLL